MAALRRSSSTYIFLHTLGRQYRRGRRITNIVIMRNDQLANPPLRIVQESTLKMNSTLRPMLLRESSERLYPFEKSSSEPFCPSQTPFILQKPQTTKSTQSQKARSPFSLPVIPSNFTQDTLFLTSTILLFLFSPSETHASALEYPPSRKRLLFLAIFLTSTLLLHKHQPTALTSTVQAFTDISASSPSQ